MKQLRTAFAVFVFCAVGFGQGLPRAFSGWVRTGDVKPATVDAKLDPVMKEFRLTGAHEAQYTQNGNKLDLTVYSFPDLTGAYGAFTMLREPNMLPQNVGDEAASGVDRVVFCKGNVAVDARFDRVSAMTLGQLRDLLNDLPLAANPGNPPALPRYMPNNNLSHASVRYAVGPAGAQLAGIPVGANDIAWDKSPEAVSAIYAMANGPARLTLISYPTPQIAGEQMKKFEGAIGADHLRRTHSIVVMASGASDAEDARSLLNFVNYDADLTWNQATKLNPKDNVLGLLANVIVLSAVLGGIMLVVSLSFGGFRALYYRMNPAKAAQHEEARQMIRLNL